MIDLPKEHDASVLSHKWQNQQIDVIWMNSKLRKDEQI